MTPAVKFAADLNRLAERINRYLATKYDSANVRSYLNDARSQIGMAAAAVGQLPETWKAGRAKKVLSPDAIKKMKEKAAKLLERAAEAEAQT
jgi:hypothetical protein